MTEPAFRATVALPDGREFDITENLRVMYDAIVGSMDWGSGFLDSEEASAISRVGEVCGFELSNYDKDECANCGHVFERHGKYGDTTGKCFEGQTGYYRNPAAVTCPCPGYARKSLLGVSR